MLRAITIVSPQDALVVINALNRQGGAGEGEGTGETLAWNGTLAVATLVTDLSIDRGVLSSVVTAPEKPGSATVPWTNQTLTEHAGTGWLVDPTVESNGDVPAWKVSDELEELLTVLGGDIADQWFRT